jgi:hypothetical protein
VHSFGSALGELAQAFTSLMIVLGLRPVFYAHRPGSVDVLSPGTLKLQNILYRKIFIAIQAAAAVPSRDPLRRAAYRGWQTRGVGH